MPQVLQPVYTLAVEMALDALRGGDKAEALRCLGIALRAANAAKSADHRRAIFIAMNKARAC